MLPDLAPNQLVMHDKIAPDLQDALGPISAPPLGHCPSVFDHPPELVLAPLVLSDVYALVDVLLDLTNVG